MLNKEKVNFFELLYVSYKLRFCSAGELVINLSQNTFSPLSIGLVWLILHPPSDFGQRLCSDIEQSL